MTEFIELPGQARQILHRDGMYLDERKWDEWLALYTEDCVFWVPTWKTEEELTSNPHRELSHIYLSNRAAVAERIWRVRSRRSPATIPLPRTSHMLGNTEVVEATGDQLVVRSSFNCSIHYPVEAQSHNFFGRVDHRLVREGERYLIAAKQAIILNDTVPASLDFYCV